MRIAYVDAVPGATGSMLLGALLNAGWSLDALGDRLAALNLPVRIQSLQRVDEMRRASRLHLVAEDDSKRTLRQAAAILDAGGLPESTILIAKKTLAKWAAAATEGQGRPKSERYRIPFVTPLELALVTGFACGLVDLGIDQLASSDLVLGATPQVSPVVASLLSGFPVRGTDAGREIVSPAAAAILSALAVQRGPLPRMTVERVVYSAPPEGWPLPGVLSLWLGTVAGDGLEVRSLLVVETNIDDMNPEFYDYLMDRLFAEGALDVNLAPVQMKKNRPATLLRVLCASEALDRVRGVILTETTTLGVRVHEVQRYALPRRFAQVATEWGAVTVKIARLADGTERAIPEYDDCRRLATKAGVPLQRVYAAALALALAVHDN